MYVKYLGNTSHFSNYPLDDLKKELQQIVRSEITEILGKTLSRRNSVAEQENGDNVPEDDLHNVTFDVIIPDIPTTDFPVHKDMFGEKENLPASPKLQKIQTRRQTVEAHVGNVRRSARITQRRMTTVLQETFKKPPTPVRRRKREGNVLQSVLKATEEAKGKKSAKNVHKQEILKLLNTGNLKELQCLSQIGLKTAFHILTQR